jgi:uncharacterized protein
MHDAADRRLSFGRPQVAFGIVVVGVAAALLLWAKWLPYGQRIGTLATDPAWSGSDILSVGGVRPGDPPSWQAAVSFTAAYADAVWKALVAAVLISALIQALVPRGWWAGTLNRRHRMSSAAVGGLMSTPSMMCTCCAAPVVVGLRREGVGIPAAVAYWLGNPLLNPAVIVFLLFVAPWQWAATRLVVGALVVVVGAAVVARVVEGRRTPDDGAVSSAVPAEVEPADRAWVAGAPRRLFRALVRLVLVLVPEYFLVVMAVGAFRGWLFPIDAASGVALVLLAAVVGALVVIPTAGEIPILTGLVMVGVAAGPIGALLLTLPAASLPGAVMVGRSLGWRTTLATGLVVVLGGVLGAVVLELLG